MSLQSNQVILTEIVRGELVDVRYGSLADVRARIRDVRFTPEADMLIVGINVCYVPQAVIAVARDNVKLNRPLE
jgi:hypothetical protein